MRDDDKHQPTVRSGSDERVGSMRLLDEAAIAAYFAKHLRSRNPFLYCLDHLAYIKCGCLIQDSGLY